MQHDHFLNAPYRDWEREQRWKALGKYLLLLALFASGFVLGVLVRGWL